MGLSRDEFVLLGMTLPADRLLPWAGEQAALARQNSGRLQRRGINPAFLEEIETRTASVRDLAKRAGGDPTVDVRAVTHLAAEALSYWYEVRQIATVEFGTDPDDLARFRPGVRVGSSLRLIAGELDRTVPLLREYIGRLGWLGVDDAFIQRGADLAARVREGEGRAEALRQALSPEATDLDRSKGLLYELVRKLVRIGRLEFRTEPEKAARFNYDTLRRAAPRKPAARARPAKAAVAG